MKKLNIILVFIPALFFNILSGQVFDETFYSQALDQTRYVDVYLPPGYDANTDKSYPVIYFLHGFGGSHNSAQSIMDEAETLINSGQIEPVIIVCADNTSVPFTGSFYVNSSLNGDYEDYMVDDLLSWVESSYRVISDRNHRALFGQSMGGYGSFRLGILHKEKFSIIAAHGAAINFDLALNDIQQELQNENQPGPPYYYDFYNTGLFTNLIFGMSGAFTPNLSSPQTYINPQNVEFPLDDQSMLIDSVYATWKTFDPVSYAGTLSPSDSVSILFGAGSDDELHLYPSNVAFKDTLDLHGLDYEFYDHTAKHAMPIGFKIRALEFIDSVMLASPITSACVAPSNQYTTGITSSSVNLNWTENGGATNWQIRLGVAGFDTTGNTPTAVTENNYTWTNLDPNQSYEWYVKSMCDSNNESSWVGPHSFATTYDNLLAITLPFQEGFEANDGISQVNKLLYSEQTHFWSYETDYPGFGRVSWGINAYLARTGGTGALTLDKTPGDTEFATNAVILTVNLSNYSLSTGLELSFWWADHKDEEHPEDKVWIRGSDTDEWIEIYDLEPESNDDNTYILVSGLDIDATLANASPSQTAGETFQLQFTQKDNWLVNADGISFDDIEIIDYSCTDPSSQSVSNITQTSAELNWTENGDATTWQIILGEVGFDTTTATPVTATVNSYTWSNLDPTTTYDWYVQSVCSGGNYSAWTGPEEFTTDTPPPTGILPFTEDWETNLGSRKTDGDIYTEADYAWYFITDKQNYGRAKWGSNAYKTYSGSGALTLDRAPKGSIASNKAILEIDLSPYIASSDLYLSFWWADHKDEEHVGDKIWIRGNDTEQWVEIYDLNPRQKKNNQFHFVSGLDIDAALDDASQVVSATTQFAFGQSDSHPVGRDGITFDDITIEEDAGYQPSVFSDITFNNESEIEEQSVAIYTHLKEIFIKSYDEFVFEHKEVEVYDIYGRLIVEQTIEPSNLSRINVRNHTGYLIVKVKCAETITVSKVFVN